MRTVEQIRERSKREQRRMIVPTVPVDSKTPEGKRENQAAVQRVINEHHAVLCALKNR